MTQCGLQKLEKVRINYILVRINYILFNRYFQQKYNYLVDVFRIRATLTKFGIFHIVHNPVSVMIYHTEHSELVNLPAPQAGDGCSYENVLGFLHYSQGSTRLVFCPVRSIPTIIPIIVFWSILQNKYSSRTIQ